MKLKVGTVLNNEDADFTIKITKLTEISGRDTVEIITSTNTSYVDLWVDNLLRGGWKPVTKLDKVLE